ncbi:DUF2087 domain-containing protein [Candidatus Woesearchaeota archaeon]|nr:DUF2087 domain-containing protein [Candidatus Woesearchaeota archaeon]
MDKVNFPADFDKLFDKTVNSQSLPRNDFQKQPVLLRLLEGFEDRIYSEQEVNEAIKKFFDDFTTIRRELIFWLYAAEAVDAGILGCEAGVDKGRYSQEHHS